MTESVTPRKLYVRRKKWWQEESRVSAEVTKYTYTDTVVHRVGAWVGDGTTMVAKD